MLELLRLYHRYDVVGIENIPRKGRALLVVNHSFATYDIALLFDAVQKKIQRTPRPLADRRFFELPFFDRIPAAFSGIEGKPGGAAKLLSDENLVLVAPGGMKEMVRPSTQKYQLHWQGRMGFIRLALKTQTPIILAVCPRADDIYQLYRNPITKLAYERLRFPVVLARGVGPTLVPRPVKLIHHLSTPIIPPACLKGRKSFEEQVVSFHQEIYKKADSLMARALES